MSWCRDMLEELLHPPGQTLPGVFHHPVFKFCDVLQVLLCVHWIKHTQQFDSIKCFNYATYFRGSSFPQVIIPSTLSPSSVSQLQHASRASFFSLSQTYPVACPHPFLSSVKWFMCFLSTLNQAHSIVCHHPVFHVGDKILKLPHALWVIPRVNMGQVVYHLLFQFFDMLQMLLVHPGSNTPVV